MFLDAKWISGSSAGHRLTAGNRAVLLVLLMICGLLASAQTPAGPVVTVTGGKVQGKLLAAPGGAVFKAIPFAAPPVGDLRWREPKPVVPWQGIRSAAEFGAACVQPDSGWNKLAATHSSEDCLFVNVWTPEWPTSKKKAVMVWMHGGGNNGGSAMGAGGIEPPFDGESLARQGVVLVSIQYRLGLLGFIGHPELTAESPHHASGNYGLMDQIAALQWVRDNIAQFGGDPANVTLFGQSAGAQNTSILLSSPLAKGLLHKAILQSGSPMINDKRLQSQALMEQLGLTLAEVMHAPASGAIKDLRGRSASEILQASADFRQKLPKGLILDVGMDNYVVPQFSPGVYRAGKEMPVPMIVGSNGVEGGGVMGRGRPGAAPPTPEQLQAAFKIRLDETYGKYPDLLERALKLYGLTGDNSDLSTYAPHGAPDVQFATDLFMRCEAGSIAGWHSAVAPTFQYEFNAALQAHPPVHSAELDFVFGFLRDQEADARLKQLSTQMQQYWTNFAKTGDPNGLGLPKWSKFDATSRHYLRLDNDGITDQTGLRAAACAVYTEKLTRDIAARP